MVCNFNKGGACSPQFYPRRLQGSGGTFTSPNFPFNYNDNADCEWLLQSFNGQCEVK
jgi:CUB domain